MLPSALALRSSKVALNVVASRQYRGSQRGIRIPPPTDPASTPSTASPSFELTFDKSGATEFIDYSAKGKKAKRQRTSKADDGAASLADLLGPDMAGWEALVMDEGGNDNEGDELDDDREEEEEDGKGPIKQQRKARERENKSGLVKKRTPTAAAATAYEPVEREPHEWGLEEVAGTGRQPSLTDMVANVGPGIEDERGRSMQWGGTGGASFIDYDAQEAVLSRIFKPHKVTAMLAAQREAEKASQQLKRQTSGAFQRDHKQHSQLRIIAGAAAGRRLLSSQGQQTRPMMEKVRQAIFNMIQSQAGSVSGLPPGSRWLDLFAGTGSVGLEALSRGAAQCHFVEMDPWVTRNILGKNINTCKAQDVSVIHTMKAEDFLKQSSSSSRFAGGAFDFISVCPPYLLVSYPELFSLLDKSPMVGEDTIIFVEYAKQLSNQIPSEVKGLQLVRRRKYGRTYVAVYAPKGIDDGEDEDEQDDLNDQMES